MRTDRPAKLWKETQEGVRTAREAAQFWSDDGASKQAMNFIFHF